MPPQLPTPPGPRALAPVAISLAADRHHPVCNIVFSRVSSRRQRLAFASLMNGRLGSASPAKNLPSRCDRGAWPALRRSNLLPHGPDCCRSFPTRRLRRGRLARHDRVARAGCVCGKYCVPFAASGLSENESERPRRKRRRLCFDSMCESNDTNMNPPRCLTSSLTVWNETHGQGKGKVARLSEHDVAPYTRPWHLKIGTHNNGKKSKHAHGHSYQSPLVPAGDCMTSSIF